MTKETAMKILKELHDKSLYSERTALETIFPELKESEDDRIRKAIIEFFELQDDNTTYSLIPKKDILAWLEKQGNVDTVSYEVAENEKREFVGDGFIKCYADFQDFKEGETYWLEYVGKDNYNVRSDNLLGKTYHITPCQLYTIFKKQNRLEKQKYVTCNTIDSNNDEKIRKNCIHFLELQKSHHASTVEIEECIAWLEKQVERNPAWSEEDSKRIDYICDFIRKNRKGDTDEIYQQEQDVKWLKSLKQRLV